MSHRAIASALSLTNVSTGERLVAFSLASFANREQRAWPGTRLAAARAGLSKSRYLANLAGLVDRGMVEIESSGGGRGRSALIRLAFAARDGSVGVEVNAQLFESVLSYAPATGSARVLFATLAAMAGEDGAVEELTTEEICDTTGLSERTYRRARAQLLESAFLKLKEPGGGRGRTNRWQIIDPSDTPSQRSSASAPPAAPSAAHIPAVSRTSAGSAMARDPGATANPGQNRTVSTRNPGQSRTVCLENPGQNRTAFAKTPAESPAQTPALYARAGREPLNLRTGPPDPPEGGQPPSVSFSESYLSPAGRRRTRTVQVDRSLAAREIAPPDSESFDLWRRVRAALPQRLGAPQFEIWLADLRLVAVSGVDGALLLDGPAQVRTWVGQRFAALLGDVSTPLGRLVRVASDRELALLTALDDSSSAAGAGAALAVAIDRFDDKEAAV